MKHTEMEIEHWSKEFDEKWPHLEMWSEHAKPMRCEKAIKSFISSIIAKEKENCAKVVEGMKKETPSESDRGSEFSTPRIIRDNGYNTALTEASAKIRGNK